MKSIKIAILALLVGAVLHAKEGDILIDVNITKQKLTVFKSGKKIFTTNVSTGRTGHPTPVGSFKVFAKEKYHKSTLYPIYADGKRGGAKMNYMLKFAPAVAIHEGEVVYRGGKSVPVSHGCIRVSTRKAKEIFKLADIGTRVVVHGKYISKSNTNKKDSLVSYAVDFDNNAVLNMYVETSDIEDVEGVE